MSITVRPGLLFDVEVIADFQVKMALETEQLKLDLPTVRLGVGAVIDDPGKGKYWIAELDGEVIGCLLTVPEWSDWRNGSVLWIHSVYIQPEFRKRGAFKALYQFIKTMVTESHDLRGVRLYVDKTNLHAKAVYETLGMNCEHYELFEWMKG